jgi:hypothetical protein
MGEWEKLHREHRERRAQRTRRRAMTANEFRKMALGLAGVVESAHMEHPDFRVGGRIFATLGYPDEGWGVVMLTQEEQKRLCGAEPEVFVPVKGAWGRAGNTQVNLEAAKKASVKSALKAAYEERVRKNGKKERG